MYKDQVTAKMTGLLQHVYGAPLGLGLRSFFVLQPLGVTPCWLKPRAATAYMQRLLFFFFFSCVWVPCRVFCWCGQELSKWILGDTFCGRERPGEPRGHKLCLIFMQCTECKCKKAITLESTAEESWCPKQWQCPGCSKELHGATCSKAGSAIVVVH